MSSARIIIGMVVLLHMNGSWGRVPPQVNNAARAQYGDQRGPFRDEDLQSQEIPEEPRDFDDLNAGLPVQIEQGLGLKRGRNYIVLIKKAPQYVFDFRTADRLRRSLMTMNTNDMDIGHAMVAWQCQAGRGRVDTGATGSTGEQQSQGMQMLRSGWGLSTFMSSFRDGYLNVPEEVEEVIEEANQAGRLRFLAMEVTNAECRKMLNWLKTYINHPKEPQRHFGLNLRPDKFEGSGCGSFAVTMLEQSGAFPAAMTANVWRTLNVPTHLLGVGSKLPPFTDYYRSIPYNQNVFGGSIMSDYWSCRPGWAPCHKLRVADPEMIIHLISSYEKAAAALVGRSNVMFGEAGMSLKAKERRVRFIEDPMDRSPMTATQLIDGHYDRQTAVMEGTALAALKRHLAQGGKLRPGRLMNVNGLIIEKGASK